uniref:LRRCT domain-containing protein n=1 Tax=Rhabditophanes sp. KR3021 TaxID=114890 RepID=A0AC35U1D5_9BILA
MINFSQMLLKTTFTLLFLLFLSVYSKKLSLKSNFDASCPARCVCSKTTFKCTNLNQKGHELFIHADPRVYPDMDTFEITGNNVGDISETSFFDHNDIRHVKLTSVDISNNKITAIGEETFIGFPSVENFNLAYNEIHSVGEHPLEYQTKLRVLNLTSSISKTLPAKQKADLIFNLFRTKENTFTDLNHIILADNGLEYLHKDTFCVVEGLTRLNLENNLFTSFDFEANCLKSVVQINMRNNKIKTLAKEKWDNLAHINALDFSKNPLECNCKLMSFIEFANNETNLFTDQGETQCASPDQYKGTSIFNISHFQCRQNSTSLSFFKILLLFLSIFLIASVYLMYRFRGARILDRIPFNIGYSKLGSQNRDDYSVPFVREDRNNGPVFL